jgi:hypothetical protein
MLTRTLIVSALLTLTSLAAPAAAQDAVAPAPAAPVTTAPVMVPAAAPASATLTSGAYAVPPGYATTSSGTVIPTTDRRGRMLVGTRHEMQSDRGLWGLGLGLFLAGWALDIAGTAIFNAVSDDRDGAQEEDAMAWSILPFVGPFVQLGLEAPHPALPITSGLLQITGLVLFVLGMTSQHDAEIPVYAFGDPSDARTARLGLDLSPTAGGAYATLTLHSM